MADFTYIHEHPWLTLGLVAGGGFVLFLVLHRRSATADQGQTVTYAGAGAPQVDPNIAAQVQMQQQQVQGDIAGLTISGQTQLGLAQIGAQVQTAGILAGQDVTNRQTDAQVRLGLGTLDAQTEAARIDASIQMRTIDALIYAFSGNHPLDNPTPVSTAPVLNSPGNPVNTSNPVDSVTYPYPVVGAGAVPTTGVIGAGGSSSGGDLVTSLGLAGQGTVVPGGTQLVPYPTYMHSDPANYPGMAPGAICSPLDANCVATNEAISNQYHVNVAAAQDVNNLTQLVANYQFSQQAGVITPAQSQELAQYSAQLVAMGGTVPAIATTTPAQVFPSQVNTPTSYPISDTAATLAAYSGRGAAGASRGR
jgi:hypothetical protein